MTEINWFETIFGFVETDKNINKMFKLDTSNKERISLYSKSNNTTFEVGSFECISLNKLRKITQCYKSVTFRMPIVNHIITNDIFKDHYKNPGALFQVASQFNCLEMVNPNNIPEYGITIYKYDRTQGPSCAIACAAATLYRNYFAITSNNNIGQTENDQINNLDKVEKIFDSSYFWLKNGYLFSDKKKIDELNLIIDEHEDQIMSKLEFGLNLNTEVCFSDRFVKTKDKVLVSQIFCSAISCSYSGIDNARWEKLARIILKSCYEATLLSAIYNRNNGGTNKVFLTFIGGGAFGNDIDWIIDAINYAIDSIRVYNSDLEINICHYRRINEDIQSKIKKFRFNY